MAGAYGPLYADTAAVTEYRCRETTFEFLKWYVTGDLGEMVPEDQAENRSSVERGNRVFSSYKLSTDQKLWVITEWDRSVTTLLLPNEY